MALKGFAIDVASLSGARAVQTLASFISVPIVARLVGPAEFGLVALAMTFVVLSIYLADAGMGQSLVRTPLAKTTIWSTAFWTIAGFGVVLALALAAAAWPVAVLFHEPRLFLIVSALAAVPLLVSLLAAPTAEMQQRRRFRELALFDCLGAIAGVTTAIALALRGAGAWALVAQQISFWLVKAALIAARTRFRPRFLWRREGLDEHVLFARDTVGSTLLYFVSRQIDPLVIGKVLGAAPLGLYAFAARMMILPQQLVGTPLQNAMYVKMVELRDDKPALRQLYLILTGMTAMCVFPGVAMLAAASHAYFSFFLSDAWRGAATVFMWLSPFAALGTVTCPSFALLNATGRTAARVRQYFELAVLWVIALPISAHFGIVTVAATFSAVQLAYLPRALQLTLPSAECSIAAYLRVLVAPTLAALALFLTHLWLKAALRPTPVEEIGASLAELAVLYAALAWSLRTRLHANFTALSALVRKGAPAPA
jgi:O-antigen/teichoic acid export membrane protein